MSCRRAYDIDLAAFLEAPRREEFDDFRSHYPACAVCAAEVRAWTELHLALATTGAGEHPEPERLLRYEEDPGQLAQAEREALSSHLAHCASCRDELAALRAFEPAALAQPAAAASTDADGFLGRLRRVLWHPAFAYAVALLVLAPTLWQLVGPSQFGSPMLRAPMEAIRSDDAVSGERAAARKAPDAEPAAPADVPGKERANELAVRTLPLAEREKDTAGLGQEEAEAAPAPAADPDARYSGFQRERLRPAPAQERAADAEGFAKGKPAAPSAAKRQAATAPPAGTLAASEDAMADATAGRAMAPSPSEPKAESGEALRREQRSLGYVAEPETATRPGRRATDEVAEGLASVQQALVGPSFRRGPSGLVLHVPTAGISGAIEVRLRSPDGRRELVERFPQAPPAGVELAVPPGWLRAGAYRVELRGATGERSWSVEPPR